MRRKSTLLVVISLAILFATSEVLAQRGGGGRGGGASRGGAGRGGASPGGRGGAGGGQVGGGRGGSGGFGGGLSSGPASRPGAGAGGRGGPNSGAGARPGTGAGGPDRGAGTRPGPGGEGARAGLGAGGIGGPDSGVGARPGLGAGGAGAGARPGLGAGGIGGPDSGVGALPGVGAGGAGAGVRPGLGAGGIGGPDSGVGVLPGVGAGAAGASGARRAYGTYYASPTALAAQGAAFRASTVNHATFNAALYSSYPSAWQPINVVGASLYTHPGYRNLAVGLGLAAQAVPYDYGGNVVVQTTGVYIDGDSAGTPEEFANSASQIAATGQSSEPADDTKWLPLGVFAIVEGEQTNSDDVFQLAVDKQGILRGNYHNLRDNSVESVTGSVDKQTQRAAWTIGSDQTPVYEAGIVNLTKDETPILVHTPDGPRQMQLIRLPEPPEGN